MLAIREKNGTFLLTVTHFAPNVNADMKSN